MRGTQTSAIPLPCTTQNGVSVAAAALPHRRAMASLNTLPHGQKLHKISWPDLKFNQWVRLKHTQSSYLELVDTVASIANNAVAFLSGETSVSPHF